MHTALAVDPLHAFAADVAPSPACLFCGEEERAEILEIWGHEFMLDTCCQGMHEYATSFLNEHPEEASSWIGQKISALFPDAPKLRRVASDDCCGLVLDFHPRIEPTSFGQVRSFVESHHRHCAPPRGWRFGCKATNGGAITSTTVGVLSAGRPVARMLDGDRVVEVNRLCIDPGLPSALVWNVASQLYGWAAKEARSRGFEWIVTYTLAEESGVSLLAAGWVPAHMTRGGSWSTPSRHRDDVGPTGAKLRWHRKLARLPSYALQCNAASLLPGGQQLLDSAERFGSRPLLEAWKALLSGRALAA